MHAVHAILMPYAYSNFYNWNLSGVIYKIYIVYYSTGEVCTMICKHELQDISSCCYCCIY